MISKVTFLMSDMKIEVLALSWGGGGGGGEERGGGFMHVQEHRHLLVREVYINLLPWQHCCCQGNVLNGSRPSVHIAAITK